MHKKSHIKNLEDIIEEFRVGNYDSFDEFYHQTNKQLYVFIYDIIRNRQSSEDLLQETYMRFLNHIDKYKKNTNYFNFLVTIARNLAINEYHKQKRMVYDEEYIYSVKEESPTDVPDLFYLLDYLNEKEREIVILHMIDNLKFKEIAKMKDKPLGTILWLYNKAIKKLKRKVEEENEN
ncbi:MAG TPA: RNA polymerase sigma factor [Acholeplasmatales bacterium]|jgi:RNA polymerase sigma factor, sigma-70 family|nr:rNA polymerase sigma-70 factor ECF subfamily [Staphylococcus sp. CAG:324]HAR58465.1 RNA polymerase sigma factor [Acholeplasmatales bacterium]